MNEEIPEAPWRFVKHEVIIESKKFYVRYVGKEAREMIEGAMCRDQCHQALWKLEEEINGLKSMVNILTEIIGGPEYMIEYFKGAILKQLSQKAFRQCDLVSSPYMTWKRSALEELLKERKVKKNRSWITL